MIYEKFMHTWNTQDIAGYFSCLHEDYQMIFHSTGKTLRLEDFDMDQLARWMISTTRESARCIYENEDILVEHRISTYTDGERSATILVHLKKDGCYTSFSPPKKPIFFKVYQNSRTSFTIRVSANSMFD